MVAVVLYYNSAYRIQSFGTLPDLRGPSLIVANHQHEIESSVILSNIALRANAWRSVFTVSSRRMWEPGFLAERLPWLSPLLRELNFGWLFAALGMQPLENELSARPYSSIAFALRERHGDLRVETVFSQDALAGLPAEVETLGDLLGSKHFRSARARVKLSRVREPFRGELIALTRAQIEADLRNFETLLRGGATIFLTPEGFYSGDGKMQRFRGSLDRLAPLARIWLAAISYDPFVGRRLSMLYRTEPADSRTALDLQLKRLRPVTVSALLGAWLHPRAQLPFTQAEAQAAVAAALAGLPPSLFVDPELQRRPREMTLKALAGMVRHGIAHRDGDAYRLTSRRVHPQFPRTRDIIEYLYNFHAETLEGGRSAA
jgi:hypothetical protein